MKLIKKLTLWLIILSVLLSCVSAFSENTQSLPESENAESEIGDESSYIEEEAEEIPENETADDVSLVDLTPIEPITASEKSQKSEHEKELQELNRLQQLSEYNRLNHLIVSLGIYSFTANEQSEKVTRGQFAKMMVDLLNLGNSFISETNSFLDVAADNLYKNEIELVYSYGIMNGVGDELFAPDATITYIQAIKTVVSALGYDSMARAWGGWKDGYIRVARELNLLKRSDVTFDEEITFSTASALISLAARSSIFEIVRIEEKSAVYDDAPGRTVLNYYHNIYEGKGVMTDNGVNTIRTGNSVSTDSTVIGGLYLTGMKNSYRDYLGCNIRFFYKDEDGVNVLLYAVIDETKNNIVTLNARELLHDDSDFSSWQVVAEVNGKKKKYKIHEYRNFMYNGVTDTTFHHDSLKIKSGTLTLIDADEDNVYELVKAWEYSDIVVKNILLEDSKISAEHSEQDFSLIKYGDYDLAIFENAYGEEVSPAEILSGNVLSVFKPKGTNKDIIRFILSDERKDIQVKSTQSHNNNGITISYIEEDTETEAEFSYTYSKLSGLNPAVYPLPEPGYAYSVAFNYEGFISMMTLKHGNEEYAYALGMGYGDKAFERDKVCLHLYFESNSSAVVTIAKKLSINGIGGYTGADLMEISTLYKDGAIIPQLVKIKLNAKGELSEIRLDNDMDNTLFGFNLAEFSLDYEYRNANGALTHTKNDLYVNGYNNRYVNRMYRVTPETKIFVLKGANNNLEVTQNSEVRVVTFNEYLALASGKLIKMYDANEAWQCGAVVTSELQGLGSRAFTVDRASYILDEDDNLKMNFSGYYLGTYRIMREDIAGRLSDAVKLRHPTSDGTVYKGDAFEILINLDGEISNAKLLYSPHRDTDPDYCFADVYSNIDYGIRAASSNQVYILGYPIVIRDGAIGVYTLANPDYTPLQYSYMETYNKNNGLVGSDETYIMHPLYTQPVILKYDSANEHLEMIDINELYSVGQFNSTGLDFYDKKTKVFFRKSNGMIYDMMLVTNIGD